MFPRFDNLHEAQREQIASALSTHGWTEAAEATEMLIARWQQLSKKDQNDYEQLSILRSMAKRKNDDVTL